MHKYHILNICVGGAGFMQILLKNYFPTREIIRNPRNKKDIVRIRYLKEEVNEKTLWKAVICQAIDDATSNSAKIMNLRAKQRALKWLTEDNEDFKAVCDLAGYSYKVVRKNVADLVGDAKNLPKFQTRKMLKEPEQMQFSLMFY